MIDAKQVKEFAAKHEIGMYEAKRALEKEALLTEIANLTSREASRSVKDILTKIVNKAF